MLITLSINMTRTALHEFSYLELLWYTLLILWLLRRMNLRDTHFMLKNSTNHTSRWSFISSGCQLLGIIKFIASFLLMHILTDTMTLCVQLLYRQGGGHDQLWAMGFDYILSFPSNHFSQVLNIEGKQNVRWKETYFWNIYGGKTSSSHFGPNTLYYFVNVTIFRG